jgi:hypothetical protein
VRLLVGWCLRGLIVSAIGAFIVAIIVIGRDPWDWRTYLVAFGVLAALSTVYFIADYLIDYDDWQREVKR